MKNRQGFGGGITIPLAHAPGRAAHLSLMGFQAGDFWKDLILRELPGLITASHLLHSKYLDLASEASPEHPRITNLSAKELSCLYWMSHGKTMAETSFEMGVRERTVRMHLSSLRAKLGVANTVEAVAVSIRSGIL